MDQAEAQLQQAQVSERSAANAGLAQAEAQVKQAQARLQQAAAALQLSEVNLSHTTIRSPIDGVVVSRNVDVGQTVAASLSAPTLFTIRPLGRFVVPQLTSSIDLSGAASSGQKSKVKNFSPGGLLSFGRPTLSLVARQAAMPKILSRRNVNECENHEGELEGE